MPRARERRVGADDDELLRVFWAIASGDDLAVAQRLDSASGLASRLIRRGASRQDAASFFLTPIHHYVYQGDTALHIAAAAHKQHLALPPIAMGADVRARNRRGTEPLHYAADGRPGSENWSGPAQREVIASLIEAGADPNVFDRSEVAPLHRAVRTRSSEAVGALIDGGADPLLSNKRGSSPLHLAVHTTGKSGSGSDVAKEEQRRIIVLLLAHGASPSDTDGHGRTVADAASSEWIRQLLDVA